MFVVCSSLENARLSALRGILVPGLWPAAANPGASAMRGLLPTKNAPYSDYLDERQEVTLQPGGNPSSMSTSFAGAYNPSQPFLTAPQPMFPLPAVPAANGRRWALTPEGTVEVWIGRIPSTYSHAEVMELLVDEVTVISLRLSPLTLLSNMAYVGVPTQDEADQLIQRLDGVFLEEGALQVAMAHFRGPFSNRPLNKPLEDLWNKLAKRSSHEEVKRTTERYRVSMTETGTARTIPRWLHDLFEGTPAPEMITSALRYRDRRVPTPRSSRRSRSATPQVTPYGVTPLGPLQYSLPVVDEGNGEVVVSDLSQEELDQWIEDSWTGRVPFDGEEPGKRGGAGGRYVPFVEDTSDVNHWRRERCPKFPPVYGSLEFCPGRLCKLAHSIQELRYGDGSLCYPDAKWDTPWPEGGQAEEFYDPNRQYVLAPPVIKRRRYQPSDSSDEGSRSPSPQFEQSYATDMSHATAESPFVFDVKPSFAELQEASMSDGTTSLADGTPPRTPPRPNFTRVNLDNELSQIIQGLGELESTSQMTAEVDMRKRKRAEELEEVREVI